MNVVIMGCGRVGARLARLFDHEGHSVTVIDLSADSFQRLDEDFKGSTVIGTGIDEDVLKRAGIADADIFLAVTNLDNPNIMASQIAKLMYKVPRVIARIYDPAREDTYHDLGLETICPTTIVAQRIHQAVLTHSDEPLDDHEIELPGGLIQSTLPSNGAKVPATAGAPVSVAAATTVTPLPARPVGGAAPSNNGGGKGPTQAMSRQSSEPQGQATSKRRFFR